MLRMSPSGHSPADSDTIHKLRPAMPPVPIKNSTTVASKALPIESNAYLCLHVAQVFTYRVHHHTQRVPHTALM